MNTIIKSPIDKIDTKSIYRNIKTNRKYSILHVVENHTTLEIGIVYICLDIINPYKQIMYREIHDFLMFHNIGA